MVVLRNGDAAKGSAACCKQEVAGLGRVGVSLVYLNSKRNWVVTSIFQTYHPTSFRALQ